MPEITDAELAAATRAVGILKQLSDHPEARVDFERSLKKLDPKIRTREDEIAELTAPIRSELDGIKKLLSDRDAADAKAAQERADQDAMERLTGGFARLRAAGLTDEGEEAVKKIMIEKTIPDPESAFAVFTQNNPKPLSEGSGYTPEYWNYEKDSVVDNALLFKNPDKWEDETIGQVLMEERRKSGGGF